MRSRLRTILFALTPSAILILIFLLGFAGRPEDWPWLNSSQLWGKGDPFYSEGSRALASPYFLFRGRPHAVGKWPYYGVDNLYQHNEIGLRDDAIRSPKPASVFRILNVGDSATWGLSLPDRSFTYSDRLSEILNAEHADGAAVEYDVINAGTIGYSSWQAREWLKYYIADLEPDLVTVYIGNNDSGPGGVSDAERGSVPLGPVTRVLGHNFFFLLLQKVRLKLTEKSRNEERERFIAAAVKKPEIVNKEQWYRSAARVEPKDHEANLRALIHTARQHGARVVLLKVPMNLVWPRRVNPASIHIFGDTFWHPLYAAEGYLLKGLRGEPPCSTPFLSHPWLCQITAEQVDTHLRAAGEFRDIEHFIAEREAMLLEPTFDPCEGYREIHQLAVTYIAREAYSTAAQRLRLLTEGPDLDSDSCVPAPDRAYIYYALGVSLLLDEQQQAARDAFVQSRKTFPFAMSYEYYEVFDTVVSDLGVEYIDLPELFEDADPAYFGSSLIHDWVHPSPEGNSIIARAIANLVSKGPQP